MRARPRVVQVTAAAVASLSLWALAPSSVHAHVCMDAPTSRVGAGCNLTSAQKKGPCGVNVRGTTATEFRPGETITVSLNETVDHPSHYRIAFNPDGDTFEDPTSKDDKTGAHPFVLLDNIADEPAAKQSVKVTLPNITCDRCTLQLIQVMYDKAGNGFGGNDGVAPDNDDLYYACADIVLKGEPVDGTPSTADAGPLGKDAGSASPDAGIFSSDAGAPAVKRDVAVALKDAAVVDDEADDTSPATSEEGCALTASSASRSAGSWFGLMLLGLLAGRRRRPQAHVV